MFGGLEIKGSSEKKEEAPPESQAPAPASSGFSFLSSPAPTDAEPELASEPAPEPEPTPVTSGFSFLSPPAASSSQEEKPVEEKPPESNDGSAAPAVSGFSFLSSAANSTTHVENVKEEASVTENNVSSGFSFLSSMTAPVETPATAIEEEAPTAPATEASNGSMFSMLNLKTSTPTATAPMVAPTPDALKPSPPSDDILSLANPSQPTGSGVVFGGAARPRAVKKRVRGKKIGAKATVAAGPIPVTTSIPEPSTPLPEPVAQVEPPPPSPPQAESDATEEKSFSKLSNDAGEAARRAEEFISSKQSNVSYTGRYSGTATNSIVEDYGDSSSNADNSLTRSDAEDSEDYKKAKAAAQEAMKSSSGSRKLGFGGGISGFFKRNLNPSPPSSVTGEKPAPTLQRKVEMKIPTYGDSNPPSSLHDSSYHEDDVKNVERDHEIEIQREHERVEEEERLKRREEDRLRLQAEREEAEMRAATERALEEERRIEQEKIRMEEERKRVEAEEAANKSPASKLQNLLEQFAVKSQNATLAVANLRQERLTMIEKRALLEKQERLATQQISQAEKQQMDAAEQEEFELADQLAAVIEQHQKEQEEKSEILKNIDALIEDIDYKKLDVGKSVWMCFVTVQKDLQEFLKEQENSDITDCSDLWEKFEKDTKRLSAENERLSADLKNIERDEGFAKEERAELEEKISEQTSGIVEMRDTATDKLESINKEIEDLRKQLEAKEMEAAEVKMELHGHEHAIDQVRSKFSRQLARLRKKESAVEESRKEWGVEEAAYKKAREDHEAEVTAHSEALIAHDQIKDQVKSEIDLAEELAKIIVQEIIVEKKSQVEETDEEALRAQAEVLNLEAAADEAKQVLTAAKSSIDSLQEDLSTIEVKLPILESEKKLAAGKRDFKAAAKASKEIKALIAKKEKCVEELEGEAKDRHAAAQKEVEYCFNNLEEKKVVAHEIEKKGGIKRMAKLAKQIINLEKLRESFCGTEEEDGHSVKSVGGFVIDSEISALMVEGDELDQKYGGWNDIMLEYASKTELDVEEEKEEEEKLTEEKDSSETELNDINGNEMDEAVEIAQVESQENESSIADAMIKYRQFMNELVALESKLETAIETENYEEAAELDDQIAALRDASESLGLSGDEKEMAMNDNEVSGVSTIEDTNDDEEEDVENCNPSDIMNEDKLGSDRDGTDKEEVPASNDTQINEVDSGCTDNEEILEVSEDTHTDEVNKDENDNGDDSSLVDDEKKISEESKEEIDHSEMPEVDL